ncbi:MAG TPA: hypothetical protein VGQ94_10425 [Terriglobales bacterium]|nr:hypothetical protein [Terriglobales bacterium]
MVPIYDPEAEKARFKELLEAAQDELVENVRERQSLEMRSRKLQEDIAHLAALCGESVEDPIKQLGLTDAIRYVLGKASHGQIPLHRFMTPVEIREAISKGGFDISKYSNVMASIHTVLQRLKKKGQVTFVNFKGGSYMWKGGLPPPPPMLDWLKERLK